MTIISKYLKLNSNLILLGFALGSFWIFSGLAGCDEGPSAADTASTEEGAPVDVGGNPSGNNPPPETNPPPATPVNNSRNVILMVGSGMGPQQIGQVVQYRRLRKASEEKLALEKLMDKKWLGMVTTHSYLDLVSDTASANTAMACGYKARNNTVGLNANGNPCETILEKAQKLGKASGIVSNAPLGYPGVAAYLTHHLKGEESNEIAASILENPTVDVLLAGGVENLIPQTAPEASATKSLSLVSLKPPAGIITLRPNLPPIFPEDDPPPQNGMKMSDLAECNGVSPEVDGYSRRSDQTNLIEQAKSKGYQFVCKADQLSGINPSADLKVLGSFASNHFPRQTERAGLDGLPSLATMTGKALELLSAKPKGFVLVVHGGMTHLTAQENDAGTLLKEGLDFDAAVAVALSYADKNPETLLIVTADHDTAGFGFAYSKQAGHEVDLPSGEHYDAPYNYAQWSRYDRLMEQKKSYHALTRDILAKLYVQSPAISLDEAGGMLVGELQTHTPYSLGLEEAKQVLYRPDGQDNTQTQDFTQFYVNENVHLNLLGRAVAPQTSAVWAAGTSTSTPVMVLATGPSQYAERVRGFIDNTDIAKIVMDALAGR